MQLFSEAYLAHYGIKGQRWGVKNGPPYPLGAKQMSAAEKKANGAGKLDSGSVKGYDKKRRGLTDKQKKALIVAGAAVAAGLAVYGAHVSGIDQQFLSIGQKVVSSYGNNIVNSSDSTAHSVTLQQAFDEMAHVNANGGRFNCMACTACYDLRRRGIDVVARNRDHEQGRAAFSFDELELVYPDLGDAIHRVSDIIGKPKSNAKGMRLLETELLTYGEGSRGIFAAKYNKKAMMLYSLLTKGQSIPNGHAIAWEVIDGKVYFLDTQNNKERPTQPMHWFFNAIDLSSKDTVFARLDNLDIDDAFIPIIST